VCGLPHRTSASDRLIKPHACPQIPAARLSGGHPVPEPPRPSCRREARPASHRDGGCSLLECRRQADRLSGTLIRTKGLLLALVCRRCWLSLLKSMGCATSKADGKSKRAGTASAGRRASIEPSGMATAQLLDRAPSSAAATRRAAVAAAVQGKPPKAPPLQQPRSTPAIDNPLWPSGHDSRRSNCSGPPSTCDSSWDWVAGGREGGSSFWTGPQAHQGDSTGSWALRTMRRSLSSDTVRASSSEQGLIEEAKRASWLQIDASTVQHHAGGRQHAPPV